MKEDQINQCKRNFEQENSYIKIGFYSNAVIKELKKNLKL